MPDLGFWSWMLLWNAAVCGSWVWGVLFFMKSAYFSMDDYSGIRYAKAED
jgi:hypothetical protein